jgi:phosphate transport system substrate-binding protein
VKSICGILSAALAVAVFAGPVEARDQIRIVGSSTVFPFSTAVAEQFGRRSDFKTPIVESTGTGGGMKLFCSGVGVNTPDMTNASRRIKESEFDSCTANGISVTEVKIGYDGIVLANSKASVRYDLTLRHIFAALAAKVPIDGKLVDNPYTKWSEIDPALPDVKISVLGPPPTSGTRDAFVELAMEGGCEQVAGAAELGLEKKACHLIREDGVFVEAGENDNLIVQKLEANKDALGIFGFSFLDQNLDKLQGSLIGGVDPTFDNIADGAYPVSRSLFFYVKTEHIGTVPGVEEFVTEFTSERAYGSDGYLVEKGLIPLPETERTEMTKQARAMKKLAGL